MNQQHSKTWDSNVAKIQFIPAFYICVVHCNEIKWSLLHQSTRRRRRWKWISFCLWPRPPLPFCDSVYFSGFKHRLTTNAKELYASLKTRHQSVFMKDILISGTHSKVLKWMDDVAVDVIQGKRDFVHVSGSSLTQGFAASVCQMPGHQRWWEQSCCIPVPLTDSNSLLGGGLRRWLCCMPAFVLLHCCSHQLFVGLAPLRLSAWTLS